MCNSFNLDKLSFEIMTDDLSFFTTFSNWRRQNWMPLAALEIGSQVAFMDRWIKLDLLEALMRSLFLELWVIKYFDFIGLALRFLCGWNLDLRKAGCLDIKVIILLLSSFLRSRSLHDPMRLGLAQASRVYFRLLKQGCLIGCSFNS